VLIGAIGSDGYKIVLILHILTAIVGLGAVMLNGLYAAQLRSRPAAEALAIAETNFKVSKVAEYFIYAIPVFGIGLVFMSDNVIEFDQTWIWLSLVLYVVALGISHGVLMPTEKKIHALMREMVAAGPPSGGPPPQAAQLQELGKRAGAAGGTLNLIVVVIVFLMVWKPGGPGFF
jgi:uncharacterized membrane protein